MQILLTVLAAVFGLLLLLILILLFGKASIRVIFNGELKLVASFCGIPFTIVSPEKTARKKRLKDLSLLQNPDRILKKEQKRQQKAAEKARLKKEKAKLKAAQKKAAKQKKKQERELQKQQGTLPPSPNLIENLEMILTLLKKLGKVLGGKFRLRIYKLHLWVATGDAASTAVLYGAVVQSAALILQWAQTYAVRMRRDPDSMIVEPDYLSEKSRADIDIRLSIRPYRLVGIGVRMLITFLKAQQRAKQKALLRHKRKEAEKARQEQLSAALQEEQAPRAQS